MAITKVILKNVLVDVLPIILSPHELTKVYLGLHVLGSFSLSLSFFHIPTYFVCVYLSIQCHNLRNAVYTLTHDTSVVNSNSKVSC